jgi:hypothetical protein
LGRSPLDGTQLQAQWKDPTGALNLKRTVAVDLAMSASFIHVAQKGDRNSSGQIEIANVDPLTERENAAV